MGFSDQKLLGVPIVLQPSQAEKNRLGNYAGPMIRPEKGPMKLYVGVGNLHCNISDEILKGIFEPFGRIQSIQLIRIRRRTDPRAMFSSRTWRRRTSRGP